MNKRNTLFGLKNKKRPKPTFIEEKVIKRNSVSSLEIIYSTNRPKKLDVVIVSVDYNDFLILTLSHNIKIFENITVVTSISDEVCQKICQKFGVNCIITDVMYENGDVFNKGKAINKGIESLVNPDLILLLDADIIVVDKIDLSLLNDEVLYTSDRWICYNYTQYKKWVSGETTLDNLGKYEKNKSYGFFQLFNYDSKNIEKSKVFPEDYENASYSDIEFSNKFTKKENISNNVIHLGEIKKNWNGRVTVDFISKKNFNEILKKDLNPISDKDEVSNIRPNEKLNFLTKENIVDYKIELSEKIKKPDPDYLTILITNWRRPERLKICLQSVVEQRCKNIVVGCFDFSEEVKNVLNDFIKKRPDIKIDVYSNDNGCNQLWLRTAYQSTTPFVLILHDDDFLSDNFEYNYENIIKNHIEMGYNYFLWNGQVERNGEIVNKFKYLNNKTDILNTNGPLYKNYKKLGQWPLSPVVQIFNRQLLIKTLKECEDNFVDDNFYTKPKMMLGNEILSTLRHFETYEKFVYIDEYLTKFGAWDGSETVLNENSPSNKLMIGYDETKKYFKSHSKDSYISTPYIVHISSVYTSEDQETNRRMRFAQSTWQELYESEKIIPIPLYPNYFDSVLPKIKEIFDHGFTICESDDDIIMFTNADICLYQNVYDDILKNCQKYDCTFSFRKDFREKLINKKNKSEIEKAEWYVGADLFAVTKRWWKKWRNFLPDDQVIGRPTWDWVFRIAMGYSIEGDIVFSKPLEEQGKICETPNISYHEKHDSFWELSSNVFLESNIENSKIAYNWMIEKSSCKNFTGKAYFENTYGNKIKK